MFSVIIPVYNGQQYIANTIESVLQQSCPDFEIIVINDGSTDNTESILKRFVAQDHRVSYLNQPNLKQGAARNNGLSKAKHDYVIFLDADDTISSNLMTLLESQIKENPYDVIFYDHIKSYPSKEVIVRLNKEVVEYINNNDSQRLISFASPCLSSYRREFLIENSILFLEDVYFEDIAYMIDTMHYAQSASYISGAYYIYNIIKNSTVRSTNAKVNLDVIGNFEYVQGKYAHIAEYDDIISYLATNYILFEACVRIVDSGVDYETSYELIQKLRTYYNQSNFKVNTTYYRKQPLLVKLVVQIVYRNKIRTLKLLNRIRRSF